MKLDSKILDYPVFALSYADGYLVASGGGGGQNYGIRNKLEVYKLLQNSNSEELHLESETTEQDGIIDSLDYNHKSKIWIGSMDDCTILFSYKPDFGMKIFGKFKTDYIPNYPKQNVCKFGHESNYFVTGGNECCVRVWRLSENLLKQVKSFQNVESLAEEGDDLNDYKTKSRKHLINGVNPSSSTEDDTSSIEELLADKDKLLHNDVLINRDDTSSDGESSIDDTSPSPSSASSPIFSPCDKNPLKSADDLIVTDDNAEKLMPDAEPIMLNGKLDEMKSRNKKNPLCKMIVEYRDHTKPINDCCIFNELLISVSNDCMILYKLVPAPKLLLKYKDDAVLFKFVKILSKSLKPVQKQDSSSHTYTLLTLECYNPSADLNKRSEEKPRCHKNSPRDGTQATLWHFEMMSKKLTALKSVHISSLKSSSLTLDSNENQFAVGFGDGTVLVYSVQNFKLVKRIQRHKLPVTDLTFASNEKLLTAGIDYYVFINEIKKLKSIYYWIVFLSFLLFVSIIAGRYTNISNRIAVDCD